MKQVSYKKIFWYTFAVWFVLFVVFGVLAGCATTECRPPEVVMRKKGAVGDCWKVQQDGEVVTKCKVLRPNQKLQTMTVFPRHCGQDTL